MPVLRAGVHSMIAGILPAGCAGPDFHFGLKGAGGRSLARIVLLDEAPLHPCRPRRQGRRNGNAYRGSDRNHIGRIPRRPRAGRPGEAGALFSDRFGQSTPVCLFDRVFVPWERGRVAPQRDAHLRLRHASPACLHRRPRRLRRPADRCRYPDDGGQRPRCGARPQPARRDDRPDSHRQGLPCLRCRCVALGPVVATTAASCHDSACCRRRLPALPEGRGQASASAGSAAFCSQCNKMAYSASGATGLPM